jgi:hypothetical protein
VTQATAQLELTALERALFRSDTITMPGLPVAAPALRTVIRALLVDLPCCRDTELIVSLYMANALQARCACCPIGAITTIVDRDPLTVRIEVRDQHQSAHAPDWDEESTAAYTHGLTLVHALADRWGHDRYPDRVVWWAELGRQQSDG